MDWSKSKSIFIIVFLILDVFLYSLYLNRHTEAQQVPLLELGANDIEARLKEDKIDYSVLPTNLEKATYISGSIRNFEEKKIDVQNAESVIIQNDNKLIVNLKEPVKLKSIDEESLNNFVKLNVYEGSSYVLWEIDEENKSAKFFQQVNDRTIYYNMNGLVTVYWNSNNELFKYEQTYLESISAYDEEESLFTPLQAIQSLYAKGHLMENAKITKMKLGYFTLVPLTQIQVFVPTWEIRVENADKTVEEYFINAVEGIIIDVHLDASMVEADDLEIESFEDIRELNIK